MTMKLDFPFHDITGNIGSLIIFWDPLHPKSLCADLLLFSF